MDRLPAFLAFLACLACLVAPAAAESPYHSADPAAAPVTAGNLLENDRFWPFHVVPTRDWTPPGAEAPLPRIPGVLVRVNDDGTLRADFGRFGRHELPVAATDVVERANQVRLGRDEKMAPNLVLTIGNKMLDTRKDGKVSHHLVDRDTELEAFLCVFADPMGDDFAALADRLRSFDGRSDLLTVVFPITERKDSSVRRRLREIDWKVPFVIDRFAEPYRRSIAGEDTALPHVMLLSREGRVLHRGGVTPDLVAQLDAAAMGLPLRGQSSQAAAN
jgi:hypothetical protein